jgi:hypothetical protein
LPFSLLPPQRLQSLLLAAAIGALGGTGCLRFGYADRIPRDAGADAAPAANGGDGGLAADAGPDSAAPNQGGAGAGASAAAGSSAAEAGSGGAAGFTNNAGRDAGMIDAMDSGIVTDSGQVAAADSGLEASEKCLERPGAVFCDDFETADPDYEHWEYSTLTNGTIARSMTRAHSGIWSLRSATTQGTGSQARLATLELDEQTSGDAWLRFYNWVPASVQIQKSFSIGLISEAEFPWDGFELRILPGNLVDLNTSSALGVVDGQPSVTYTRDSWVCVELHVYSDAANGFYEAYLDEALAARSTATDTTTADGYSAAEVGVHYAPPEQGPVELFADDVVVSRSRIGCD